MIDLMSIAEQKLMVATCLATQALYEPTEVRPDGHPEAVVWSGQLCW